MRFDEAIKVWRRQAALRLGCPARAGRCFAAALALSPATYQSQASVVLLTSQAASRQAGGNPTPGLHSRALAHRRRCEPDADGPATVRQPGERGLHRLHTVAEPTYTTAATGVLLISVAGTDPASVERTLTGVIGELDFTLVQMQRSIWPKHRITVSTLASSPQATLQTSATVRPIATTLVLGLIVALGLPVFIDGALRRRKVRHAASKPAHSRAGPDRRAAPACWPIPGAESTRSNLTRHSVNPVDGGRPLPDRLVIRLAAPHQVYRRHAHPQCQ